MGRKPKDVQAVCEGLAGVIRAVDPDILGIQEGPPLKAQLQNFVRTWLESDYDVYSMPHGRQSNHALVRKGLKLPIQQVQQEDPIFARLGRKVTYYRWGEIKQASIENFTRRPVVLRIGNPDQQVEFMVFHTKSKISKLKHSKQWLQREKVAVFDALRSRQKLSAEMAAVRRYLTHAILSQRVQGVILVGDLNDGPNRDLFEHEFLIHNIVDELRGGFDREPALMHHALPWRELGSRRAFTAEFEEPLEEDKLIRVLLDHVMVTTHILEGKAPLALIDGSGRIEHEAFEAQVAASADHEPPSDHRPVSARFKIK